MSYPFVNQQYAQNSYDNRQQPYGDAYGGGFSNERHPDSYDSAYRNASRDGYGNDYLDGNSSNRHGEDAVGVAAAAEKEMDDRKSYNEGSSPYGPSSSTRTAGGDGLYGSGKGIWTYDDKRAMARRGVAAKIFRALFCLIFNAIIVIISIICLVVIFARPFNVGIGTMSAPSSSSVGISGSAITFNGSVDFIVSNPNSISSDLSLSAKVFDNADKSQDIGRGSVTNSRIGANSNSTIHFPYQVRYDPTADKNKAILQDLVQKCGLTGGSQSNLDLTLDIDASIKILSVPVPVSFSQAISFKCPISADILRSIGGGDLLQIIGSLGSRAIAAKRDEL